MSADTSDHAENTESSESVTTSSEQRSRFTTSDVVIGMLIGLDEQSRALVVFPESPSELGMPARSTVPLSADDVGREVALLFENGNPERPLIIGRIHHRHDLGKSSVADSVAGSVDGERIEFKADKEIVLKCGKASITLTKAGKVLIRGSYLLSRSSGANRIKGGSIQLN